MDDLTNILILTLTTGEEVITNLKDHIEKVDGVDQKVCYNMVYPFVLVKSGTVNTENNSIGVQFVPWKLFSSDTGFLISYDNVVNMCTPLPSIKEQYKDGVDHFIKNLIKPIK